MKDQAFHIEFSPGDDGYVIARCLEIPGCVSQGKDRNEALLNILDAIQGCLSVMFEVDRIDPKEHM